MSSMMHRVGRTLAVAVAMTWVGAVGAGERYRVSIGKMPPIDVDDAPRYSAQRDPDPKASPRPVGRIADPSPRPPPPKVAVRPHSAPKVRSPQAAGLPVTSIDPDAVIEGRGVTEPPAGFAAMLAKEYGLAEKAAVRGVWYLLQHEPKELLDEVRTANAVVRWMLAAKRKDLAVRPQATTAKVKTPKGIRLRESPWGAAAGEVVPDGTVLELRPPASGIWYRVVGPGAVGWAPGVWLDLE